MKHIHILTFCICLLFNMPSAMASFDQGAEAFKTGNWFNAIKYLRPAAEAGDARALVLLGHMYNDGKGVKKDHNFAFEHYERAANLGDPDGLLAAAAMTSKGLGTMRDMPKAFDLFSKAAEAGNIEAQIITASFLLQGHPLLPDVKPDLEQAYIWFGIANKNTKSAQVRQQTHEVILRLDKNYSVKQRRDLRERIASWSPKAHNASDTE